MIAILVCGYCVFTLTCLYSISNFWLPPFLRSFKASLYCVLLLFLCWGAWVSPTVILQKYEFQCNCTNPWDLPIKPYISHIDNISLLHENLKVDTSKPSINIVEVTLNCFLHCLVYQEEWGTGTTSHMEPLDILNLYVYWCIFFSKNT